jgi:hypothetical protein
MHLIACFRQFTAGTVEYSPIIDRVTTADMTDSQNTPQQYRFDAKEARNVEGLIKKSRPAAAKVSA